MTQHHTETFSKQMTYYGRALVVVFFICALAFAFSFAAPKKNFVSSEIHFADPTTGGLQIMPASCASAAPSAAANGYGYWLSPGAVGQSVIRNGVQFCISNNSGNTYFIPAASAYEMNLFRSREGALPGVYEVVPSNGIYTY